MRMYFLIQSASQCWSMGLLACLIGVSPVPAAAETLRTALSSDIRGLMPGRSPDVATGAVLQNIYEGLVAWKADGTVAPMLADTIAVGENGTSYVFGLRQGVAFHNGAPLTAQDVAWTWSQFLDPKNAWPCRGNFEGDAIRIDKIEALDALHVRFKLAQPTGALLSAMARSDCDSTGIAHPDSVGPDGSWTRAIGTGPFRLGEWRKGEFVELVRNEAYAPRPEPTDGLAGAKAAKLDRIRLTIIPDSSSAKAALEAGNLDLLWAVDAVWLPELREFPKLATSSRPSASVYILPMQSADPVLKDKRVRQAIAMAIDAKSMAQALTDGAAVPSASLIPVSSRHYGAVEKTGPAYDPEAARKLLAEAGYKGEKIVIVTNRQYAPMGDTGIFVQGLLQAAGINAEVEMLEFPTQFRRYYAGRYQMMTWNIAPYLDPMFIFERFIGDKAKQPEKVWDDPRARDLLAALFKATGEAEKQAVFDALHRLMLDDMPMLVWATPPTNAAYSIRVKGYETWAGQKPRFLNVELAR